MTTDHWPDTRILDLLEIQFPIVQAPMANHAFAELAISVSNVGGLGSLACASLAQDRLLSEVAEFRQRAKGPLNLNYFCHRQATPNPRAETLWRNRLRSYYVEL